jgi:hypothetical protein
VNLEQNFSEKYEYSMLKKSICATAIVFCVAAFSAQGNDGAGALGVGGIVVEKSKQLVLNKQVLDIGYDKITADYEYVNKSSKNIRKTISFPLPPYPALPHEGGAIAYGQPPHFEVLVNDKPVKYQIKVQALREGKDITGQLKAMGFTERQIAMFPFNNRSDKPSDLAIPESQIMALRNSGLLDELYNANKSAWDIHVNYFWRQFFPAKSKVLIKQSYVPFIATRAASVFSSNNKIVKEFCLKSEQTERLAHLLAEDKNPSAHAEIDGAIVKYILTNAGSGRDNIREFTLRIHSGSPSEVIALCFEKPLLKISENMFEAKVLKYKPNNEIGIYFGNVKMDWNQFAAKYTGVPPEVKEP